MFKCINRIIYRAMLVALIFGFVPTSRGETFESDTSILSFRAWISHQEAQIYEEVVVVGNKIQKAKSKKVRVANCTVCKEEKVLQSSKKGKQTHMIQLKKALNEVLVRFRAISELTVEDYVEVYLSRQVLSTNDLKRITGDMNAVQRVKLLQGYLSYFSRKQSDRAKSRLVQRQMPWIRGGVGL